MWIGIDDTDSPAGGCTTHVLTELVRVARDQGVDVIGEPRLVRLNPNIPWKTRGNGALAVRFGLGRGPRRRIGEIAGRPVWSFASGGALPRSRREPLLHALWATVTEGARSEAETDPAMVAGVRPLPASLYDRAVRSVVPIEDADDALRRAGYLTWVRGSRRGLVGAAAAVAWPGRRATWELLTYRRPERLGTPRSVDAMSVRAAERRFSELFQCYDERTRRLLVAPHTACPILFGLRATSPGVLERAARSVRSEPVDRWLRFRTNQGTGDHVRYPLVGPLEPFVSGRLRGTIAGPTTDVRGGHVRFELLDRDGRRVPCLVFEPSKTLPAVARSLAQGETVELWGGRGEDTTFRVEGIVLGRRNDVREPGPRPRCPTCGRAARSLGRGRGYRCAECRVRLPPEARPVRVEPPRFGPGIYRPTASARRHLAGVGPVTESVTDL